MPHAAKPIRDLLLGAALIVAGNSHALDSRDPGDPRWQAWQQHRSLQQSSLLQGLTWRALGPTVQGGRVLDIESVPGQPYGFYVAYASGGVWKTSNNGVGFEPLSDALPTMITGDIAVDANRPERLWIGSGEPNSSRSSYGGMGVFLSEDGGKSFVHKGLTDVDRISRVLVHPKDSARVCVAAIGRLYSRGGRRGVFCSRDDGDTWTQVLVGKGDTGAIDLAFDPNDPETLYAATWERSRTAWNFVESGAGSGIWKIARRWRQLDPARRRFAARYTRWPHRVGGGHLEAGHALRQHRQLGRTARRPARPR